MACISNPKADGLWLGCLQAGAYYGQYSGQYVTRSLASPDVPQNEADSQLLIGVNDDSAATAMALLGEEWAGADTSRAFLLWVRDQVLLGHPVIIGEPKRAHLVTP